MSHVFTGSRPAAIALLILLLACIGLAACGGSSTKSSTGAAAARASSTAAQSGATGPRGAFAARFAAMRECLAKNGITLPTRPRGTRGGFLGGAGGGPQLPKGVSRAQYEAAAKKCGGFPARGRFAGGAAARFKSPAFKAALTKFAACLRENGVNIPAPNTSGKGPIFNTKGINTASAKFRSAQSKCRSVLSGALRRPSGAPGSAGAPPPSGESTTG